ncbi:phosphatase PAP2 family protein [Nocardioides cynanchi]|uniref:phosphatase PAP2 family protein n=1 Tax=Nocardioides cynanchi TaxID=2558918 RepID=UPI0012473D9A|nr:phosphatase PAP2 family protein [Nocardioides cynanchi]
MESRAVDSRAGAPASDLRPTAPWWRRPGARSLALLGAFAVLTATVELSWWRVLDHTLNDWAAAHRVMTLWRAGKVIFDVATPEVALPITLVLGALVAWRRRRWQILGDAAVRVGLVVAAVLVLKPLIAAPGPTRNSMGPHGGAFPSGHTTSTVVCVALVLAWAGRPRSVTGRVAVDAAVVAVVGVTVIYLSYHYLSDVVGGVVLGTLIATAPLPFLRRRDDV